MNKLVLLLLLGAPAVAAAQTTTLSPYVASDGGVDGNPVTLGVSVGREAGRLGLRWSSAVDALSSVGQREAGGGLQGLLNTDLDALLFPWTPDGRHALTPYAVGGAGLRVVRHAAAAQTEGVWSYGVGVRTLVSGPLSVEGEARHRTPFAPTEGSRTSPGWEFRAGMHLRIGRGGSPRPAPPSLPGTVRPAPLPIPAGVSGADARLRLARLALEDASTLVGVRYQWGGNTPTQGFDCSGFVRYVFLRYGIDLPRVSRDQARAGAPLPLEIAALEPGDLLAFASRGTEVDHIAIYIGEGRIIHSSSSGGGVRVDTLEGQRGRWYLDHMVAARRVIPSDLALSAP